MRVSTRKPSKHTGFGLVELMVAMAIGLIISLAIFGALDTFEGRKRTSTSINDIDQAGNYAVYAIDKWIRNAGSGFTQNTGGAFDYLLCQLTAAKNSGQILPTTGGLPAPFATINTGTANVFRLAPALILPGQTTPGISGQASDVLVVMAGASGQGESATPFNAVPTASVLTVSSATGFNPNSLILVARKGALDACMIEQVNSVNTTIPDAQTLNLSGIYYSATTNSVSLASNNFCGNAGTPAALRKCTAINLGSVATTSGNFDSPPIFLVLGVGDNNTLFGYDLLQTQSTTAAVAQQPFPIADGVFEMHALYGIDSNGDGKLDNWTDASGAYAPSALTASDGSGMAALCKIKAIRIGLIMRTGLQEKAVVSSGPLTLFTDLPAALQVSRTLSGNEQFFRYRVLDTTVPLRNMLNVTSCP